MFRPYTGRCLCGKIRYKITSNPITAYNCHCTECQKVSSSAFGMSVRIDSSDFTITRGKPKSIKTMADSGRTKYSYFCKECGTRIYGEPSSSSFVVVKAGTLDDPNWFKPIAHIWTRSAQKWFPFSDKLIKFEQAPEDNSELGRLWAEHSN